MGWGSHLLYARFLPSTRLPHLDDLRCGFILGPINGPQEMSLRIGELITITCHFSSFQYAARLTVRVEIGDFL